jgi:hypothetical protein
MHMSHDDAHFFEAVARALGERVCLIHRRGFTLVGPNGERASNSHDAGDDASDLIDLAASGWLDWDERNDVRPYRRRSAGGRRKRLKIA